jgi:transcriptional regulator with GAF, ATPase, and Fis domain
MDSSVVQRITLAVAQERSLDQVLDTIVSGLADEPDVALARIWLVGPGDRCATCPLRAECPDQTRCLHLVASRGTSSIDPTDRWDRLDGAFSRFPLGIRKIGRIATTGEAILSCDLEQNAAWIARPEWVRGEGIHTFAGQPLVFRGEVLGVLAVFSRAAIDAQDWGWLRVFADHAAVAIANARAFEEIDQLRERLELENAYLREEVASAQDFSGIIGRSAPLERVLRQVEAVAPTDASVLILGESGTGKELVARAIHERSGRSRGPFIKVNCGAVPAELFESEFFGHVRGAFTGAHRDRTGRFELADGGTLFLDEVGEIPLALQSKLLRVLQEGTYERVGDERTRRADVRIVAATNRDLRREASEDRFREDLYYRLSVFPIEVPPLRARPEDIGLLAEHFVERAASRLAVPRPRLSQANVRELEAYRWPGNVRELQNVIERAVILARGGRLRFELASSPVDPAPAEATPRRVVRDEELRRLERDNVLAALEQAKGRVYGPEGAAAILGLKPTTLASRMKALGIRAERRFTGSASSSSAAAS